MVTNGSLKQMKGTGASGSFRMTDKAEKVAKKTTKTTTKKPKTKTVKKSKCFEIILI
jgi:hypothetical protein